MIYIIYIKILVIYSIADSVRALNLKHNFDSYSHLCASIHVHVDSKFMGFVRLSSSLGEGNFVEHT